jgi:hypothetical protein
MTRWTKLSLLAAVLAAAGYAYWKLAVPKHRVPVRSELVMLGDLDGDHRWTAADRGILGRWRADPYAADTESARKLDLNRNGLVDTEDVEFLEALVAAGSDPYAAEEAARAGGKPFPRPRELYRFVAVGEYLPRPAWALPYPGAADSVLPWLADLPVPTSGSFYAQELDAEIYDEAIRFDAAYRRRATGLLPAERAYLERKLARVEALRRSGDRYELLLALVELTEDAETLTIRGQQDFVVKLLAFRDHLREVQGSPLMAEFNGGPAGAQEILAAVAGHLEQDLGLRWDLATLGPPRNFTDLENYLQRSEWQYYKSTARAADFEALIAFAQHDPRYLRAVSRTSRRLRDPNVENHNLPMVLLFREALRLKENDEKRAVGLLDEAIRNPYAWIKSIPRELLPGSLAGDNFLLPGNKEDGADKSRHWNVFGGICLYKSPEEALDLAFRRELKDLREGGYTPEGMRELFRDMIANLNGMYHVLSVEPGLAGSSSSRTAGPP